MNGAIFINGGEVRMRVNECSWCYYLRLTMSQKGSLIIRVLITNVDRVKYFYPDKID